MAAMKKAVHIGVIIGLIVFSTWLFSQEQAAEPGALTPVHQENAVCGDCHLPWEGVDDSSCLGCHSFTDTDTFSIRPAIRFHEAEKHCLVCHSEHRGRQGNISRMDHTLLNPDLLCSTCHLDPMSSFSDKTAGSATAYPPGLSPVFVTPRLKNTNAAAAIVRPFPTRIRISGNVW
jgi:hypothetical protein